MRIQLIALLWIMVLTGIGLADRSESARAATSNSKESAEAVLEDYAPHAPGRPAKAPVVAKETSKADSPAAGPSQGAPVAEAQSPGQRPPLTEIEVTAQRYSEIAYNVPIHLTVLDSQALQQLDITNVERLKFFVPGMSTDESNIQTRISIDGVANENGTGSEVSEYLDDADVTPSPNLYSYNIPAYTFYDLTRVEVLRGPQGTLYGEGAEGGAIHFITNKPDLTHFEADLRAQMLFTAGGQPTQRLYPVLNIPMSGTFGIRLAGQYSHDGGWIDQPTAKVKGINATDLSETRMEALWRPSDQFKLNLTQVYHNRKFAPGIGESANGTYYDPLGLYETPQASENMYLTNLTMDYAIPRIATLTSSTTWFKSTSITNGISYPEPASYGSLVFKWTANTYRYQHYTEEIRLHHGGSGPWQWVLGGLFKRVAVSSFPTTFCGIPYGTKIPVVVPPYLSPPPSFDSLLIGLSQSNPEVFCAPIGLDIDSKSASEFANISYDVAHRATISLGVRNFRDQQKTLASGAPGLQSGTFNSVDPSASILYRMSAHLNAYVRAAKGFRSGGFNAYGFPRFGPESLWNYAIGVKTRQITGFTASVEAFYTRWNDVQNFAEVPIGSILQAVVQTGGAVRIKGGNAAIQWQPVMGWELDLSGDYVNGRWVALGGTNAASNVGDPVDDVPRYQVNASVQKNGDIDLYGSSRPVYVRLDYSQQAPLSLRNRPLSYYIVGDRIYLMDLQAGIDWSDALSVGVEAKNVLNDRGFIDGDTIEQAATRPRPITVGVFFNARFE